jgi:hypothetical protein
MDNQNIMNNQYLIPIIVVLVILVVLIGAYFLGFFSSTPTSTPAPTIGPLVTPTPTPTPKPTVKLNTANTLNTENTSTASDANQSPSDLHPFRDLAEAIEPSVLPEAKKDYNKIIIKFFKVINSQPYQIDINSGVVFGPIIMKEMTPLLMKISTKYTPSVAAKLLKFFVLKHIKVILDNYYVGPPIKIQLPLPTEPPVPAGYPQFIPSEMVKQFMNEIYPIDFKYTSKIKAKVVNASTIAPFKYLVYNIPANIRQEVTNLYDEIVDRYMNTLNNAISALNVTEINIDTIKLIKVDEEMKKILPMMMQDISKIQKLAGENIPKFISTFFNQNILPFLRNYYTGPGIYFNDIIPLPGIPPQIITINYPNKVLNIRPKCEQGFVVKVDENGVKTCVSSYEINKLVSSPQTTLTPQTPSLPTISVTSPVINLSPTVASSLAPSITFPTTTIISSDKKYPSDLHPFSDVSDLIEPSLLPEAKKEYNKIILKVFKVLNEQKDKLTISSMDKLGPLITRDLTPYLQKLMTKYTPVVLAKLIKYFFIKQIQDIFDNYYTGAAINLNIPSLPFPIPPMFIQFEKLIKAFFPFQFSYKPLKTLKGKKASQLSPFKNLKYNIPSELRSDVNKLYNNIVSQYMNVINDSVKPLFEVNLTTIQALDISKAMGKYKSIVEKDISKIQEIFGKNAGKIATYVLKQNLIPLLKLLYTGPDINIVQKNPMGDLKINYYKGIPDDSIVTLTPTSIGSATPSSSSSSISSPASSPVSTPVSTPVSSTR